MVENCQDNSKNESVLIFVLLDFCFYLPSFKCDFGNVKLYPSGPQF